MTDTALFSLCNTAVLPAWLLLLVAPRWQWTDRLLQGVVVASLCVLYAYLLSSGLGGLDFRDFGSLEGVSALFSEPRAVLVGWIHYLAFDLMTGMYIKNNASEHRIPHWWIIPCLIFCFLLGPVGLGTYFVLRSIKTARYFV